MDGLALLAWNLRRLRSEQGISQERLAADSGVDRAYISELEREIANPSIPLLDKLAGTLEAPLAELFRVPAEGAEKPKALKAGRKKAR